jgi:hypothetical protein
MAVYTAPTTRSTGALISASIWNTDLVENIKYLKDAPVFDTAVIVGAATTSGIRLDIESGALAVREGDDSAYGPLSVGALLASGAAGTAGQVLTSGGTGVASSWTTPSSGTPSVLSKSANYTVQTSDGSNVAVLCTNTITITLYAASGNSGKVVTVKNNGTGTITIDGNASETIDGSLTKTITAQYTSLSLLCDGTGWAIF